MIMNNTEKSFFDKWQQNKDLAFISTLTPGSDIQNWILNRNGWNTQEGLRNFLSDKKRILDAGCGNGRVTALLSQFSPSTSAIVGVDLTSCDVARENLEGIKNIQIDYADLLANNSALGKFDFIYSQEVLHHTHNPKQAFLNLVKNNLMPGGEIAIYVYKKKAPMREFTDDYIRENISCVSYEEAKEKCSQITELGKVLHELNVKINIPKVDLLQIEAGEYDLQRFIYHFFMKCFWSPELNYDQNTAINYDWYHPQNCTRHTLEEIREWYTSAELKIEHKYVDFYGITLRGKLI
jgi:SAM-dependent methyltransferase